MRGLKLKALTKEYTNPRRTPPGVRGLKHEIDLTLTRYLWSHPARGAWIETDKAAAGMRAAGRTPPGVRGLKLKPQINFEKYDIVAPRPGCVD